MSSSFPLLGSISEGTHRASDLAPAYLDTLEDLARREGPYYDTARQYLREMRDSYPGIIGPEAFETYDPSTLEAIVDELRECLEQCAPPYVYFGTLEGDGADVGFWVDRDRLDEDIQTGELPSGDELPDEPADATELYLEINDHGNVTLYAWNGAEWLELWAVV